MTTSDIKAAILQAMAKAFFASAWADMAEESGNAHILSGKEIMDVMPEIIDPAAMHAAVTLQFDMERANNCLIEELFISAKKIGKGQGDRERTPENFGHYCAMQTMGGVGLWNAFGRDVYEAIRVPYVEFGSHSLSRDNF